MKPNQSLAFGLGVHSQTQPLEVYFYQSKNANGETELTNKDLDFVKSYHAVLGYDLSIAKNLRLKTEVYGQLINNAAVERASSSFSMLNSGADFYFPDKTNLINNGKGYNYGLELTLEHFLDKGFYYLITGSLFDSKYKGSDEIWRNTAFNSNFTTNFLIGKEYKIKDKQFFGIDSKLAYAGGQRYTPFDIPGSAAAGYVIYQTDKAYSLQNNNYFRLDIKFTYTRNGAKTTQKWYLDLQNFTNHKNLYVRTLNPTNQTTGETYQVGFFPNFNYKITF